MKRNIDEIEEAAKILKERQKKGNRNFLSQLSSKFIFKIFSILHRFLEIVFAFVLWIFILPLHLYCILRKLLLKKDVFERVAIFGKNAAKLKVHYFNLSPKFLRKQGLIYEVFKGNLSVTGVSIRHYYNEKRVLGDAYLYNQKPGIFTLYFIREASKTAHEGKHKTDLEYVYKRQPLRDFILVLKSIPALFYYEEVVEYSENINLLDVVFANYRMTEAIDFLDEKLEKKEKQIIYFVNPDCMNKISDNKDYLENLQRADCIFPDGIGIKIACKMLHDPLKENINGTDMLPFICELSQKHDYGIFLLGAKPGRAEIMKEKLEKKYDGLKIAGTYHGYFDRETETDKIINMINSSTADILLVAFGAPLQEQWIDENRDKLDPAIAMGVGGLIDFYSGSTARAPRWMREIGIEWIYRLLQEPGRMWKRYVIGNPLFIFRIMKWKMLQKFQG